MALATVACSGPQKPDTVPPVRATSQAGSELATTVQAKSVTRRGGSPGTLADFVAAIGPRDLLGGQCQTYQVPNRPTTLVVLTLTGNGKSGRTVSIEVDSGGRALNFTDIRGNTNIAGTGPRTSVLLDFGKGTAQASNEGSDGFELATGSLSAALMAANLGAPQTSVDALRKQCLSQ